MKEHYPALEFTFESQPQNKVDAKSKMRLNTYSQLYVYANLAFAKNMIGFVIRLTYEINRNYYKVIDDAPPHIQVQIDTGSFYEEVLKSMVATTYEQVQKSINELMQGGYEKPKIDYKIYFHSPKIVINEHLMNERAMEDVEVPTIIIDLGLIQADSKLIKEDPQIDYREENDKSKLYDYQTVKFGKIEILVDYNLHIISQVALDTKLNWQKSKDCVPITNKFNFGVEVLTCLTPYHQEFPSMIANLKINEIALFISQKTIQTLLKFTFIYQHGSNIFQ